MSTVLPVLNNHVRKLARREIRSETAVLRRNSAQHRRDIAGLKRALAEALRALRRLQKSGGSAPARVASDSASMEGVRYSARSVRAQRKRLGLSAADYGKLVGVTAQSVYNWERGDATPRGEQLARVAALRAIGKREAMARLEQASTAAKPKAAKKAKRKGNRK